MSKEHPLLNRQRRLAQVLDGSDLDALALNPGATLTYLTGLYFHLMERPFVLLFRPGELPCLVLPELEMSKLEGIPLELQPFPYSENPQTWPQAFKKAAGALRLQGKRIGVEANHLRFLELELLREAARPAQFAPAEAAIARLRMFKDDTEIAAMRSAARVAERALQATLPHVQPGMSEKELAAELVVQLLRSGSDPKMPFSPIVASGPNSANPHAAPGERRLAAGDLLLFDWGAAVDGYVSDITRTFALGQVDAELLLIAGTVRQANRAARDAVQPGRPMAQIDLAARRVIENAGYGPYFIHRTGHGLGMEGHEEPYIRSDNLQVLEAGMTFTIEPGIYLPGRGGVRIEDDVLVTQTGLESFTSLDRSLIELL